MRYFWLISGAFFVLTSCSTVKSTTTINPTESFVLGNNKHGAFKVKLRNDSRNDIEVLEAPIDGGKQSSQIVKPNSKVTLKIQPNTALVVSNKSQDTAYVNLKVTGDVGLSMDYKR